MICRVHFGAHAWAGFFAWSQLSTRTKPVRLDANSMPFYASTTWTWSRLVMAGLLAAYNQPLTQSSRCRIPATNMLQLCPAPSGSKISNYPVLRAALVSCGPEPRQLSRACCYGRLAGRLQQCVSLAATWAGGGAYEATHVGSLNSTPSIPAARPFGRSSFLAGSTVLYVHSTTTGWPWRQVKVRHARSNRPMVLQAVL